MPDFPFLNKQWKMNQRPFFNPMFSEQCNRVPSRRIWKRKEMNFGKKPKCKAQARIKITMTLSKIAELEKVEVSNEDLPKQLPAKQ
jgi:hypothetical protein